MTVTVNLRRLVAVALIVLAPMLAGNGAAEEIRIEQPPSQGAVPKDEPTTTPAPGVAGRDPRGDHAPAFIAPFVGSYETLTATGQFGLSGWTTTNPPVGPPYRDVTGWLSFGFTFTWDPKPTTATR
jgi:hypothetical protein